MRLNDAGPVPMKDQRYESRDVEWDAGKALSRWENEGGAFVYKPPEYPDPGYSAFDESR